MSCNEWKYVKKNIVNGDVERFERLAQINIPDNFRAFILEHNNGRPIRREFNTEKSRGRVFDKLLSFNESDKENVFGVYRILSKELPDNLVAIAADPFGNFICLDKNSNLRVVFWQHETSFVEETGKDFIKFVADLS